MRVVKRGIFGFEFQFPNKILSNFRVHQRILLSLPKKVQNHQLGASSSPPRYERGKILKNQFLNASSIELKVPEARFYSNYLKNSIQEFFSPPFGNQEHKSIENV